MIIDLSKINFGGGGGSKIKVQDVKVVTQNVDSSGAYDFQPDEGYDAMKAVKANLTIPSTPVQSVDLDTGISFAYSTFTTLPFNITGGGNRTDFDYIFSNCRKMDYIDLSQINTSKAERFFNSFSQSLFKTLDVSNFDTSQVVIMSGMFFYTSLITSLDLSNFNTSNVLRFDNMFAKMYSMTTLDIRNFDLTNANNTGSMFSFCDSLTTVKVTNCNDVTKNKILTQLQTDLKSYTWTLGDDGIIRRTT